MIETLDIKTLDTTPAKSVRASLNQETVERYKESYLSMDDMPPIHVFEGGGKRLVGDGVHRVAGSTAAGIKEILAQVERHPNETEARRAAVEYACGANEYHGLPRSAADKRAAVEYFLSMPDNAECSDRQAAEACRVSTSLVRQVREAAAHSGRISGPAADKVQSYKPDRVIRGGSVSDGKGGTKRKPPEPKPEPDETPEPDEPFDLCEPVGVGARPAPAPAMLDAKGREVPPELTKVFAQRTWFRQEAKAIADQLARVKAAVGPHMDATFTNDIEARGRDYRAALLSGMPYVVCPISCTAGKTERGLPCSCCRGRGWIAKGGYSLLTNELKSVCDNYADDRKLTDPSFTESDE